MRFFSHKMFLSLAFTLMFSWTAYAQEPKEVTITVLETSDVHGHLTNYDYSTGVEDDGGLVKCATIIKKEREKDPNLLLVDCGDTSQGNLISEFRHDPMPPVAKVLNVMGYDIWELGNHEFNFDFPATMSIIKNFKGDVLAGNIYKKDGTRFVKPYVIKEINGLKVAIIGVDAPHIPSWEADVSHYDGMTFTPHNEEIEKILNELRPLNPDVIIVMAHYGEHGERGGAGMYDVGKDQGSDVDAYLIGHAHSTLLKYFDGKNWVDTPGDNVQTCLMETGCNGKNVGKLTLTLQQDGAEGWKIKDRKVEILSCADAAPDPEVMAALQDIHERSLAMSNRVIGYVSSDFFDDPFFLPHMPKSVLGPCALTYLANKVMLLNSNADVSMSAVFTEDANVKAGKFHFKDACNIYRFDNTLMGVKMTGEKLKKIMELRAGAFYQTPAPGDVTLAFNPKMRLFDYDVFTGVDYEIDVSKPIGQRIQNLKFKGQPLAPDQELVLAMNNFRFAFFQNLGLVTNEDVVFESVNLPQNSQIRDMITQYIADQKTIDPVFEPNWKIVGYNFDDPQKELIYDMIRAGKIKVPVSEDGRSPNCKAINANELRKQGIIPPID